MGKKGRNQIPDFSPKAKHVPGSAATAKVKPPTTPKVATVKPQATSSKSGRRGG
ncbi:MAG: hypothetical protein ABIZ91_11595 [Gemmatimonadaceae bacterium]